METRESTKRQERQQYKDLRSAIQATGSPCTLSTEYRSKTGDQIKCELQLAYSGGDKLNPLVSVSSQVTTDICSVPDL